MRERWTTRLIYVSYGIRYIANESVLRVELYGNEKEIYIMCLSKFKHDRKHNERYKYVDRLFLFSISRFNGNSSYEEEVSMPTFIPSRLQIAERRDHEREL